MSLGLSLILGILFYLILKENDDSRGSKTKEKCKSCGKEIDSQFLYCPYCKEELRRKCSKCGILIDTDWRCCPFCSDNDYNE